MSQPNAPIDFDQLHAEISAAKDVWVDRDHAWRVLVALKGVVKSEMILKQRARQGGSNKNVELVVTASVAWRDYLTAEVEACTAATAALVALKLAQTRHDGGRSANAARNAELKALGG
jgi:hypothetical protein